MARRVSPHVLGLIAALALTACGAKHPASAADRAFDQCDAAKAVTITDPPGDVTVRSLVKHPTRRPPGELGSFDIRHVRVAVVPSRWLCVDITGRASMPDRRDYAFYATLAPDQTDKAALLSLGHRGTEWAPPGAPETEPVNTLFRRGPTMIRYAVKIGEAPSGLYGMTFGSFQLTLHSLGSGAGFKRREFVRVDCVAGWHAYPSGRRAPGPRASAENMC